MVVLSGLLKADPWEYLLAGMMADWLGNWSSTFEASQMVVLWVYQKAGLWADWMAD